MQLKLRLPAPPVKTAAKIKMRIGEGPPPLPPAGPSWLLSAVLLAAGDEMTRRAPAQMTASVYTASVPKTRCRPRRG
jgi:hypothetical protein